MHQPDLHGLLEALAQKYKLRYVEEEKRYTGLHSAVVIDVWQHGKSVYMYFFSPTAHLTDVFLEKFKGFSNLAQTAIPVEWLQWRSLGESTLDTQGCLLELDPARLAAISEDEFLGAPEAIVADLHSYGAALEPPDCSLCHSAKSTYPLFANYGYQFACQQCFDKLRDFAPDGVVKYDIPIRWKQVAMTLALWSAAFTFFWGLIQQGENGIDGRFLLVAPFAGSIFFCRAVGGAAQGMSFSLRVLTVTCILFSILAGNIWGFHTAVLRQAEITWAQAIELYFTAVIPDPQGSAGWFLLGGLAGSWVGFGFLKKQNVVKYR